MQAPGKHISESFGHVLHDQETAGKIFGKLRKKILQSVWTASRDANRDHSRWPIGRGRWLALSTFRRRHGDNHFRRAGSGCYFYLQRKFSGDMLDAAGGGVLWFGDEVESAEGQSF